MNGFKIITGKKLVHSKPSAGCGVALNDNPSVTVCNVRARLNSLFSYGKLVCSGLPAGRQAQYAPFNFPWQRVLTALSPIHCYHFLTPNSVLVEE